MATASRGTFGNLPAELTSFVGRRGEVAEVKKLLAGSRLVTLTGVGGVGKTRLALRVAALLQRGFRAGVWLVELDGLLDEALVAPTVAGALGLRDRPGRSPEAVLVDYLAGRQLLLLLDNCEHVVDAVAKLADLLLCSGPQLRILATSREPLAISGEAILLVPPLAVPDPRPRISPQRLSVCEAVALFQDRATSVTPDFRLTETNSVAVAEICRQLDGLPLAIELAAAWLRILAPEQIRARLGEHMALLTRGSRCAPPRQQTLRSCFEWSYELCTPVERRLWERLSVFAGGFELGAAEAVCAGDLDVPDVVEAVASLLDKSILVGEEHDGVMRFRMLETVRAFGAERLRESGDEALLRRRHRDWYQQLVLRADADWISPRQVDWLNRLHREHPDLRAALEFSLTAPGETAAVQMTAALHLYWLAWGLNTEARQWLDRALALPAEPSVERVKAAFTAVVLTSLEGDLPAAADRLAQAHRDAAQLGDPFSRAVAKIAEAGVAYRSGDLGHAVACNEEALALFQSVGDLYWTVISLAGRTVIDGSLGDVSGTSTYHEAVLALTEPRGEVWWRSYALWSRGIVSWRQGKPAQAAASLVGALQLKRRTQDTLGTAWCLEALAWVGARRDRYERAATLLGAAAMLSGIMGNPPANWPDLLRYHEECERNARTALGETAFRAAFAYGESLTVTEATDYALGTNRRPSPSASEQRAADAPVRPATGTLTRREHQVAELVAEGLNNKDIAARLVISVRTAESHVENLLGKLGFTNRTQIAAWMSPRSAGDH